MTESSTSGQTTISQRPSAPVLPLTSVRFFAATYVVLLHSFIWSGHQQTVTWFGRFLRSGYTAVGFFFVLSGFILAHVYLDTNRPFNRRSFWTSRFARAYPLLFASLLFDTPNLFIALLKTFHPTAAIIRTLMALSTESALLQSWTIHFRYLNAPSWSLSSEAFFYLVFPFVAFAIWRRTGAQALMLVLLFWACAMLTPALVMHRNPELFYEVDSSNLQWAVELMPIFRIFEFLAGIALCAFNRSLSTTFTSAARQRFAWLSLATAAIIFVLVIQFANHIPLLVMSNGVLLPAYALLILGLVNLRGTAQRFLSQRWLVILGEASYALYLLHSPVWTYFSRVHPIDTRPLWLLYLAITLTLSIASFFLLESPIRVWILQRAAVRPPVLIHQENAASS